MAKKCIDRVLLENCPTAEQLENLSGTEKLWITMARAISGERFGLKMH